MPYKSSEKRREYHREYMRNRYNNDTEFKNAHRARTKINKKSYRVAAAEIISRFRLNGCVRCGEKDECCLSAHHVDASLKQFEVSNAISSQFGLKRIEEELARCVCLCENCHRKLHAGRFDVSEVI